MLIIIKKKIIKNLDIPISGLIFEYDFDSDLCFYFQQGIRSSILLKTSQCLNSVIEHSPDTSIQEAKLGVHAIEVCFLIGILFFQPVKSISIMFPSMESKKTFDGIYPCSRKSSGSYTSISRSLCIFSTLGSLNFLAHIECLPRITFFIRFSFRFGYSTLSNDPIPTISFHHKLSLRICSIGLELK